MVSRGATGHTLTARIVFTSDVSEKLRRLLEGQTDEEKVEVQKVTGNDDRDRTPIVQDMETKNKPSGFKSSFKAAQEPQMDPAEKLLQEVLGGRDIAPADLDGEAMEEDVDGEDMGNQERGGSHGLDGEAMEDVDGEDMEDLDGEAI